MAENGRRLEVLVMSCSLGKCYEKDLICRCHK